MKNLAYLSYGEGLHIQEIVFSILSAFRFIAPSRDDYRFLVYTDRPEAFSGLRVTIEKLTEEQLAKWAEPHGYIHRRKIGVLASALASYHAPTVLVDADTYFRRSPDEMFKRIGPGRSVMHVREGLLADLWPEYVGVQFNDLSGEERVIGGSEVMWNSGVVGLDPADAHLLQEVLHMTDAVYSPRLWTAEQVAWWYWLSRYTHLQESHDVVFHYWGPRYRPAFREELQRFMPAFEGLPERDRVRACYRFRPRPRGLRKVKVTVKHVLQKAGLFRQPDRERRND